MAQSTPKKYFIGVILRLPDDPNRSHRFFTTNNTTTSSPFIFSTSSSQPQTLQTSNQTTTERTTTPNSTTVFNSTDVTERPILSTTRVDSINNIKPTDIGNLPTINRCLSGPYPRLLLDAEPIKTLSTGDNATFDGTLEGCKSECFSAGLRCRSLVYFARSNDTSVPLSAVDSVRICLIYDVTCESALCSSNENFAQYFTYKKCVKVDI